MPLRSLDPYWQTSDHDTVRLYCGNALEVLRRLPSGVVQTIVTSPPYFGLRDYQTGEWEGGDPGCPHTPTDEWLHSQTNQCSGLSAGPGGSNATQKAGAIRRWYRPDGSCKCGARRVDQQLGSEAIPDCGTKGQAQCGKCYVCKLTAVFRECCRVLRDDGTVWLNIGDSYGSGTGRNDAGTSGGLGRAGGNLLGSGNPGGGKGRPPVDGIPAGNLLGIPWRLAFALQADGWVLRQDIIWAKPSPMPESVQNRCTKSHEYIFLLSKQATYYYDSEAVKDPSINRESLEGHNPRNPYSLGASDPDGFGRTRVGFAQIESGKIYPTKNKRSVWSVQDDRQLYDWMAEHAPEVLAKFLARNGDMIGNGLSKRSSVWKISHGGGYKGTHFACVDAETEALTKTGWKKHTDLIDGEEIAAYDRSKDCLVWQEATIHRYDFDDKLVALDKRDTSQWLTSDHRCLVMSKKGVVKTRLAHTLKSGDLLLLTAGMEEDPEGSIGEDMASLVGWYTSEGHRALGTRYPVRISQSRSANPENVQSIRDLLHRIGAKFKSKTRNRFVLGAWREDAEFAVSGRVAYKLMELCPDKEVTHQLTRLPNNELEELLAAFISGDGHRRADGRQCITQKSKAHIDVLQVIAIKLGYRSHISLREDGLYALYLTRGRWLEVRCTNGVWDGVPYQDYKGVVWCPNVKSGYWMARRNGKPFITGNTFPPKLVEPCILAGTAEVGCCPECGSPWVRVVGKVRTVTRPGTDSKAWSAAKPPGRASAVPHPGRTTAGGQQSAAREKLGAQEAGNRDPERHVTETRTLGWRPGCQCYGLELIREQPSEPHPPAGATVLTGGSYSPPGQRAHSNARSDKATTEFEERYRRYEHALAEWTAAWTRLKPLYEEALGDDGEGNYTGTVPCLVMDPFIGSGTTALVCLDKGRRCWGIDLSEEYLREHCIQRVRSDLLGRPALRHLAGESTY